jgi:PP-loop superfamily ATP-utilizing enzyme
MDAVSFDPTLTPFLQGLTPFIGDALKLVVSFAGGPDSSTWLDICQFFTVQLFTPRDPFVGVQEELPP